MTLLSRSRPAVAVALCVGDDDDGDEARKVNVPCATTVDTRRHELPITPGEVGGAESGRLWGCVAHDKSLRFEAGKKSDPACNTDVLIPVRHLLTNVCAEGDACEPRLLGDAAVLLRRLPRRSIIAVMEDDCGRWVRLSSGRMIEALGP